MPQKSDYTRAWPILFILNQVNELNGHFFLQKYIFLGKSEAKIPFNYIFRKETHGPYCIDIKSDAMALDNDRLIYMEWNPDKPAWIFRINREKQQEIDAILGGIPTACKNKLAKIIEKYKGYAKVQLEKYVYSKHIKSREDNQQILSSIKVSISQLEGITEYYPPSYNTYLIQGALRYCFAALKSGTPQDIVQQNYLLRSIYDLISSINQICELVNQNPDCMISMDLRDIEESFESAQQACKEAGILPMLEEMDLALLKS